MPLPARCSTARSSIPAMVLSANFADGTIRREEGSALLAVRNVRKLYGDDARRELALDGISLEVAQGEFVCLVGPSGCGKSTLLNILAGFEQASAGEVQFEGAPVRGAGKERVMFFQDAGAALLPWLTAEENVRFALRVRNVARSEWPAIIGKVLTMVDLAEHRHKFPAQLSGGMRQRLQIARALWQLLSTFVFTPFLIPPPLVVLKTAAPMAQSGEIFRHVAISLARVGVGFATGCAAAIVLGVLLGRIQLVNELLDPIIELLRFLSPTAMIPIAVIWFGIGELSKYFLIFWGTFFIVLINATARVMRAPIIRQRAAQCLGANALQIFLLVVIPSAAPYIVTGMRIAMASSFMSIIPAEILAADSGIGFLLQQSSILLQTNRIFVALLTICVLGFVFDRIFRIAVDRMLSPYMSYIALT